MNNFVTLLSAVAYYFRLAVTSVSYYPNSPYRESESLFRMILNYLVNGSSAMDKGEGLSTVGTGKGTSIYTNGDSSY
jgi:hypothetical protein